ncbi:MULTISPECIES: cysteine desulfurase family protein [Bacillus]|uniref:cysteine desulfurase family protein n=1 Tax=Bacillus TaxID=1386 RepID=UPI0002D45682|nr:MULTISPECIES: cysteine desulfurase family protein [Bacillus]
MIYFDNSATTVPYKEVMDTFLTVSTKYFGNPSSLHGVGAKAEQLLSKARQQIAQLLEIKEQEVYFTSGGTEGNNLAIKGAALAFKNRGKHIITTAIEHPSVKLACEQLKDVGFEITEVPVDVNGRIRVEDVKKAIRKDTILVSIMHVNNEIGSIQPIEEIGNLLRDYPKILFHVDYVQGIGKVPLSIKKSGVDLCTLSGHKFHALKGTGVLYIREGVRISALFSGGSQERKIRSGTENVAGAVALAKALRLSLDKMNRENQRLFQIHQFLRKELEKMDDLVIHTPEDGYAPHIINFSVPGIKSEVLVHALEDQGIYVSTTSACSSKKKSISDVILQMTNNEALASSSIRVSLSYENELEEAKQFIKTLKNVLKNLKEVMR